VQGRCKPSPASLASSCSELTNSLAAGTTRMLARPAHKCRAARSSASPSPAPSSRTPRSSARWHPLCVVVPRVPACTTEIGPTAACVTSCRASHSWQMRGLRVLRRHFMTLPHCCRSCCWTRRRARWTPPQSGLSRRRSRPSCQGAPPSLSPTGSPPSRASTSQVSLHPFVGLLTLCLASSHTAHACVAQRVKLDDGWGLMPVASIAA